MQEIKDLDPNLLSLFNRPVPRYTSYPTAPQFGPLDEGVFREALEEFDRTEKPLSIYIHIPFCKTMCLFCGCSVVLNRKPEVQADYLSYLLKEISLTAGTKRRVVSQLHLGGGTPTSLTEEQFDRLLEHLRAHFTFSPNAELSIEIDPRTVVADGGRKLAHLRALGFNRVSFGVQDLDQTVQNAIRRRQTEEMTVSTYRKARELGFSGINIDLIYGLPHQTVESFSLTAEKLISLKPDRIAFYSYAHVPWLKPHQLALRNLPDPAEKFRIYTHARAQFMQGGYLPIGMDHFSLPSDPLHTQKLTRNFQGYTTHLADDMLGFGITSIGFLQNIYFQNTKHLSDYQKFLSQDLLPIARGYRLSKEDLSRREAILSLMCNFSLKKPAPADLSIPIAEGLLEETKTHYHATALGRLFIRLAASSLDAYLHKGTFSRAV